MAATRIEERKRVAPRVASRRPAWMDSPTVFGLLMVAPAVIVLVLVLLYPAFDALREDWRESAALLGASTWRYWCHIGLPVLTPALVGTFVILLANALGAYATVYALTTGNFNIVPIRIAALVAGDINLDPWLASALAMLLVGLMALITLVHQWLLRRSYHAAR